MRRIVIFLVVVGILLFCIAPFALTNQFRRLITPIYDAATNLGNQQETVVPKLEVSVRENGSYWGTNETSGLPELISNVAFSFSNLGNGPAENIEIVVKIDGERISSFLVELLKSSETYSNSVNINTKYNSANIVTVDASSSLSSATKTFVINANLTRNFDKTLCRLFVTPEDKAVIELRNKILKDKPLLTLNWMALRDWVGTNIQYKSDLEIHNEIDFWQFPNETLTLGTGDCEDFSILLCSLLRADGWSSENVHVIVGEQNNLYHAWVRMTWNNLQYNIEPQGNGFAVAIGDILSLSGYNAKYYFNDEKLGTFD